MYLISTNAPFSPWIEKSHDIRYFHSGFSNSSLHHLSTTYFFYAFALYGTLYSEIVAVEDTKRLFSLNYHQISKNNRHKNFTWKMFFENSFPLGIILFQNNSI